MANPNAQLQAAIGRLAAQPGITPDQEAQLRAAISQDANLLQHLNQDAANGQLKGFALPQAGAPANLAGTYDMASGIVTLPATSFQPTGAAPSADLVAALRVQDMSLRFAHTSYVDAANVTQPVTQDMVTNLQSTINGSPVLAAEVKRAVTPPGQGQAAPLQHFASLSGTVAGGTYNPTNHTMSLPPGNLAVPPANFGSADLTFVLGHEIQHGFNAHSAMLARNTAYAQAERIAKDSNPINDYTGPIGAVIQSGREDEAKAQIAGWNALLSREQQKKPNINLTDMLALATPVVSRRTDTTSRVLDFIEQSRTIPGQAQALTGLSFNTDGSMSMTAANVARMGQNYFDKPPVGTPGLTRQQTTGIGFHGDSDYPNYYGAGAVSGVIAYDRAYAHAVNGVAPQMQINMGQLRLHEDLLERNGITLPQATATIPQVYWDTSTTPPTRGLLQHTRDAHQHINPTPGLDPPQAGRAQPGDPGNPNTPLFEKIRDGVRGLDQQAGKPWDENSERLSASLLLLAGEKGFTAKDDLKIATNTPTATLGSGEVVHLWRTGHPSPDPAAHRAHMPMQEALAVPAEQRFAQLEVVQQQARVEELQRSQQQETVQAQSAPVRSM